MKKLVLSAIGMTVILAIAFLVSSPFTPSSTANPYVVVIHVTVTECWDTSRPSSLDVLCSSSTSVSVSTTPKHDTDEHPGTGVAIWKTTKRLTTNSCYLGCSSS